MSTEYDEKGKIFTDVITKQPVAVLIQTSLNQIHGEVYVRPGSRLIDELNAAGPFAAITNAVIYHQDGRELFRSAFLTVNLDQIQWVLPETEIINGNPHLQKP